MCTEMLNLKATDPISPPFFDIQSIFQLQSEKWHQYPPNIASEKMGYSSKATMCTVLFFVKMVEVVSTREFEYLSEHENLTQFMQWLCIITQKTASPKKVFHFNV